MKSYEKAASIYGQGVLDALGLQGVLGFLGVLQGVNWYKSISRNSPLLKEAAIDGWEKVGRKQFSVKFAKQELKIQNIWWV